METSSQEMLISSSQSKRTTFKCGSKIFCLSLMHYICNMLQDVINATWSGNHHCYPAQISSCTNCAMDMNEERCDPTYILPLVDNRTKNPIDSHQTITGTIFLQQPDKNHQNTAQQQEKNTKNNYSEQLHNYFLANTQNSNRIAT